MNAGSTRPGVGPIGFSDMGLTTRRVRRGGDGFDKEEAGSTGEDGFDKEEVGSTGEGGSLIS